MRTEIKEIGKTNLNSKHTSVRMWEVYVHTAKRRLCEHKHINFEIALVLDGEGVYNTPKGILPICKNDIFVFASNEPHCITESGDKPLKMLNLHFSNIIIENNPILQENYPYIFYNHSNSFSCKIENSHPLINIVLKIKEELTNKQNGYSFMVSSLIGEFLIMLIREHNYYSGNDDLSQSIILKLKKGIDFINKHYCEEISLKDIAAQSSITPNYFSALFKECLNMNLWDYITAKRIEKAKRLLGRENELNILDIALQCGFNNTANFNRSFKICTGTTPSIYRKNKFENII